MAGLCFSFYLNLHNLTVEMLASSSCALYVSALLLLRSWLYTSWWWLDNRSWLLPVSFVHVARQRLWISIIFPPYHFGYYFLVVVSIFIHHISSDSRATFFMWSVPATSSFKLSSGTYAYWFWSKNLKLVAVGHILRSHAFTRIIPLGATFLML